MQVKEQGHVKPSKPPTALPVRSIRTRAMSGPSSTMPEDVARASSVIGGSMPAEVRDCGHNQ